MALTKIDVKVRSTLERTPRVRQVSGMFDVPLEDKVGHEWHGEIDLDWPWQVGLIVGPSGAGKSTLGRELFGLERELQWSAGSVVDDFADDLSIRDICEACSSVGFNTIPSWLKPYGVLSTGEKFRVQLARLIVEAQQRGEETVLVDEFTSVVDRQVAKVGSHAVQKFVRRQPGMRFVAVSCHEDIIDWLQPDWVLRPADMTFARRSLQRSTRDPRVGQRPALDVAVGRLPVEAWRTFAPFHYMSADINNVAQCFGLWVGSNPEPVAFTSVLYFPHAKRTNIVRLTRTVVLPDWQGLGLAFVLKDLIAAAYRAVGLELRSYPAHPAYVKANDAHPKWRLEKKPKKVRRKYNVSQLALASFGGRPNAVFAWAGEALEEELARSILGDATFGR